MSRVIRHLALLVAAIGLGCASPPDYERGPDSLAFSDPGSTWLGRELAPTAAKHPGESGFQLLDAPQPALQARLRLAALAERSIDAQYFIWQTDTVGHLLVGALVEAADRGVRVRLLVDDVYLGSHDERIAAFDGHPNLEVRVFNANATRGLGRTLGLLADVGRLNHRMHNKLFLVDGGFGVAGGRNMGDEYFALGPEFNFRDRDVLVAGPVVETLGQSFDDYWNSSWTVPIGVASRARPTPEEAEAVLAEVRSEPERAELGYPARFSRPELERFVESTVPSLVWGRAEVLWDRPDAPGGYTRVADGLRAFASGAQRELLASTPYFILSEVGLDTFRKATGRGAEVAILTNSLASTDVIPAEALYAVHRKELLEIGVRMFELRPDARLRAEFSPAKDAVLGLHAKAMVADREVVYMGTFNLDQRSAVWNSEVALIIHSPELAGQVANSIARDMQPENSWEVVRDASGYTVWLDRGGDEEVRHSSTPQASFGRRMRAGFASLFPIEGQL